MPTAFFEIDGAVYDREIQAREAKNRVVFIMICDIDRGRCVSVLALENQTISRTEMMNAAALLGYIYMLKNTLGSQYKYYVMPTSFVTLGL